MSEDVAGEVIAEPVVAPEAEVPVADIPVAAETPPEAAPEPDGPPELTADQKAIKKLEGRVGFKTKELNAAQAALAEREREIEAYKALINGAKPEGAADPAKPAQTPSKDTERTFTRAEVEAEASRIAAARDFNAQADSAYEAGKKQFPDFEDAVVTLREVGAMTHPLVEAALATGEAPAVLHFLGNDPDEATRISNLNPVRMGVELAKLATKLSAPKSPKVSSAPAPIKPLGGTANPEVDVYDPKLLAGDTISSDYLAMRAKQGSPYARAAKDRSI